MKSLLLSPSHELATPRGWTSLSPDAFPPSARYGEIHCVGAGSLLLWLMLKAGCAPRSTLIVCHGPLVLPTPSSCAAWLRSDGRDASPADDFEWRRQAIALGAGGALRSRPWLEPLLRTVATGQATVLADDLRSLQSRWERSGRLVHLPLHEAGSEVGDTSWDLQQRQQQMEFMPTTAPLLPRDRLHPDAIVRCAEDECDWLLPVPWSQ